MLKRGAFWLSPGRARGSQDAQSQIANGPDAKQYLMCDMAGNWNVVPGLLRGDQVRSGMAGLERSDLANSVGAPVLASFPKGGG